MKPWSAIATAVVSTPLMASIAAFAGESVDEQREVEPEGVVQINNVRGEVRILGWDDALVSVEGELDDLATNFIFEVTGDHTLIKVEMPRRDVNYGDGSDLTIQVPRTSRVEFSGVSTDVSARKVVGGLVIRTVSGEIDVREAGEEVVLKSVSGDIDLEDAGGRVRVSSVSGELRLRVSSTDVSVDTVSGDVELELGAFDQLSSSTVSGDQEVNGQLLREGRINMKSVSGEIDLTLAAPVDAEISISTGPGGDIINNLTGDRPREAFPARASLNTSIGDGSGEIRISAVSGDVSISGER